MRALLKKQKIAASAICLAVIFGGAAGAAGQVQQSSGLAETLVTKGRLESGIVACQACHGGSGEGDAGSGFGNLNGLSKEYLSKELEDFQAGTRENRVMQLVVKNLTAADIEAVSLYFASLKPQVGASNIPEAPAIGTALAQAGDASRDIPSCLTCHGAEARSSDKTLPMLFGQHPLYIKNQLFAWRDGLRRNDAGSVMADIAKKLSPAEIDAVAIYFARLPRAAR